MRWTSESPAVWPPDAAWQRAWQPGMHEILATTVDATGLVTPIDSTDTSRTDLHLVSGVHLQPGAEYRLAPHVTTGVLRGWVAAQRALGVEWIPGDEPGRADLEVHGLDRLTGVRAESTLRYVSGHLRFDVDPDHLLDIEVEVPWLRVELGARVTRGRLRVDLRVRGLGVWWPTLAPLFAAGSAKIQQGLDETVHDLGEGLTKLPTEDTSPGSWMAPPPRPTAEEREAVARREIDAGMAEIARRQHAADEMVRLLPWWRRTRTAWQRALDGLPAASWPPGDALRTKSWPDVEGIVTYFVVHHPRWRRGRSIDTHVERVGAAQLGGWQDMDKVLSDVLDDSGGTPGPPKPWLTDAATDLSWSATPWSTVRHLIGAATDDEARARTEALVASEVS
jgi:hypothetical protein